MVVAEWQIIFSIVLDSILYSTLKWTVHTVIKIPRVLVDIDISKYLNFLVELNFFEVFLICKFLFLSALVDMTRCVL